MIADTFLQILMVPIKGISYLLSFIPSFPEIPFETISSQLTSFVEQALGFNWFLPMSELGTWAMIIGVFWIVMATLMLAVWVMNYIRGK